MKNSRNFLTLILLAGAALGGSAQAGESPSSFEQAILDAKPILNLRLRYEMVDQEGFSDTANAVTARLRAGFETGSVWDTSVLVDFDWVEDLVGDFNSTTNGNGQFPVVPDPNVAELNRLQITNKSIPDTVITLGRQRIILDDARFVGNVGWRQNEQTFDALRVANTSVNGLKIDVAYINRVNRIFGDESPMGNFEGDTVIANASYKTPVGKVTGFGYFLDFDDAPAFSSNTYGARLTGDKPVAGGKLDYSFSYAKQVDAGNNPADYDEDYFQVSGGYAKDGFSAGAGYEVLTGNGSAAFQTPLATLHKFQGWADKFLTTPAGGLEDISGRIGYAKKDVGPFKILKVEAVYHDFSSENTGADLGHEIDLVGVAKWDRFTFLVKYAHYDGDSPALARTSKFWTSLEVAF